MSPLQRVQFHILLSKLRHGVYTKDSISLRNSGMKDADLTQLLDALTKKPNNVKTIDVGNSHGIGNKNKFTEIIVADIPGLVIFTCDYTGATCIKFVNLPKLKMVTVNENSLTEFEFYDSANVTTINASQNPLESFDTSKFPNLEILKLSFTRIKSIDLSGLPKIKEVNVDSEYLNTLSMVGLSDFATVLCNSQYLDVVSLNIVANRKANNLSTMNDTYIPEPNAPVRTLIITEEAISKHFNTWLRMFKRSHGERALLDVCKNVFYLSQVLIGPQKNNYLPIDVIWEIALFDFKTQSRQYMKNNMQEVLNSVQSSPESLLAVEKFIGSSLKSCIKALSNEARKKVESNKGFKAAMKRISEPQALTVTNPNTQIIVKPKRTLAFRAVAPLTWMLGSAKKQDKDNSRKVTMRRKLKV